MSNEAVLHLPRWRWTRWIIEPSGAVPPPIRASLLDGLYGSVVIFAAGILNTFAVSAVAYARNPGLLFLIWMLLEVTVAAVRLPLLIAGRRALAAGRTPPTDLYIILTIAWAAAVGYGTFISVMSGDWVLATLACISAAAMVGGICLRNYVAPRLVATMITLSLGPCCIAAALSGELILILVAIQVPVYLLTMTSAAFSLNRTLVGRMVAERENDHNARHDSLTGVLNRCGLPKWISERSVEGAEQDFALLYLDLDGFKAVNDTMGHAAGDEVLVEVARRLRSVIRQGDAVARLGGDEFVIVSAGANEAVAAEVRSRIISAVSGSPYQLGDAMVPVGVSVGVATSPSDGCDFDALLAAADAALYRAKTRRPAQPGPEGARGSRCAAV